MTDVSSAIAALPDKSLLVLDDDAPFRIRLARARERRGFDVVAVDTVSLGIEVAQESAPAFAVVDLRLADGSGLDVVAALRDARPESRIVMLTGYGNIATAVAAVKEGAVVGEEQQAGGVDIQAAHGRQRRIAAAPALRQQIIDAAPRLLVRADQTQRLVDQQHHGRRRIERAPLDRHPHGQVGGDRQARTGVGQGCPVQHHLAGVNQPLHLAPRAIAQVGQ